MSLAACASVCVCTWKRDVIESGALFSFQRESAFSRPKNHERASKCMHTCVGRYCDGGNDEWAAHFKRPTLPRWWGSLRDTGQSLITLPVRVSQPHLHNLTLITCTLCWFSQDITSPASLSWGMQHCVSYRDYENQIHTHWTALRD